MPNIKVLFLEPTDTNARYLRRFERYLTKGGCGVKGRCHDAAMRIEDAPYVEGETATGDDLWPHDDPRWPTTCERCAYIFRATDHWQLFLQRLYRRVDTGELVTLADAPVGAMWYADWMGALGVGPDDHSLVVKTPGGDWLVDSRASNCGSPHDKIHKCWVRHGDPRTGDVHVDKNGVTCSAGAGSIMIGHYHGFLHNGFLVGC